jgi:hypothetical protein
MSNDRPLSDSQLGALGARYWLGEASGGLADRPMNPLDPLLSPMTVLYREARYRNKNCPLLIVGEYRVTTIRY